MKIKLAARKQFLVTRTLFYVAKTTLHGQVMMQRLRPSPVKSYIRYTLITSLNIYTWQRDIAQHAQLLRFLVNAMSALTHRKQQKLKKNFFKITCQTNDLCDKQVVSRISVCILISHTSQLRVLFQYPSLRRRAASGIFGRSWSARFFKVCRLGIDACH